MKSTFLAIILLFSSLIDAKSLDIFSSAIVTPKVESTVTNSRPVIAGIVLDVDLKPIRKAAVTIFIDNRKVATIKTEKNGVWSYHAAANQALKQGTHYIEAFVEINETNKQWLRPTFFTVDIKERAEDALRSGNVSVAHSEVSFPYEGAYTSDNTPTVIGVLRNSSSNPVSGENVAVKVDGSTVQTVTSNSNGVFSYTLTGGQALSEAAHTVGAHCVQTNVDLTVNNFVVDVTAPAAPVITAPTQNETVTESLVVITGTTEADATVTTYLDGDTFGDVNYADGNGDWSVEYDLDNGPHTLTAQAEDLAHNQGASSGARDFEVNA